MTDKLEELKKALEGLSPEALELIEKFAKLLKQLQEPKAY